MSVKGYYEILGVRVTAKLQEIELAVKGRRTQYHPDKYAQGDADTIQWATGKMQEVNEAYRVLSDPTARAHYDQNNCCAQDPGCEPERGNTQSAKEKVDVEIESPPCILGYLRGMPLSLKDAHRFHFASEIPSKKLNNAIACRNIFEERLPDQCFLLVDDTIFEGGADGLLITDEFISFKETFSDSSDFHYGLIWNGSFSLDGSIVQVSGKTCKKFAHISRPGLQMLVSTLNQFFADRLAWCRTMAAEGHTQAQFSLSLSVRETLQEQLKWLTLAAQKGHVAAQHNLGVYFYYNNPELAFQWLVKSAQGGSKLAEKRLQNDIFRKFM